MVVVQRSRATRRRFVTVVDRAARLGSGPASCGQPQGAATQRNERCVSPAKRSDTEIWRRRRRRRCFAPPRSWLCLVPVLTARGHG